jgi:hypothetical protein
MFDQNAGIRLGYNKDTIQEHSSVRRNLSLGKVKPIEFPLIRLLDAAAAQGARFDSGSFGA